jgi:hypothetical protein
MQAHVISKQHTEANTQGSPARAALSQDGMRLPQTQLNNFQQHALLKFNGFSACL